MREGQIYERDELYERRAGVFCGNHNGCYADRLLRGALVQGHNGKALDVFFDGEYAYAVGGRADLPFA